MSKDEVKGKGLYEQMKDSKVNLEYYNNLDLGALTEFAKSCCPVVEKVDYPELSEEDVKDYIRLIKLVKEGYLYQISNGDKEYLPGKRKFVLTTGSKGCKDFIKHCIKDNIPPQLIIPEIWIIDDERNIMVRLMEVKWVKINKDE